MKHLKKKKTQANKKMVLSFIGATILTLRRGHRWYGSPARK
jgi:hypothetical protein